MKKAVRGLISSENEERVLKFPHTLPGNRSLEKRISEGKARRNKLARERHGSWKAPSDRVDPIKILIESNKGRLPHLIPIRYGRMLQSPFGFYRGAASIMAADLAYTPSTGFKVQLCGDCHLLNFGGFATPERRLIFDINDFDETLPGPWEWDLKRLVTSFVIASRNNAFTKREARETALACARLYRKKIASFAEMRTLDVWYESIDLKNVAQVFKSKEAQRRLKKRMLKTQAQDVLEDDFPKLTEFSQGKFRIKDNIPLIFHPDELERATYDKAFKAAFLNYRETLSDERRLLLDRYKMKDIAIKVVGVGSVGTWCGIMLMMASDKDPLFLQVKEARVSVLEPYLGKSIYTNRAHRVVAGQRLMQSASDIFLGWTVGRMGRHFYIRQLRDMKMKPLLETFTPELMLDYARICAWALARAHARSGDAARICGYLGKSDVMDEALADFAELYADQNEKDHQALVKAVGKGRIEVSVER